MTSFVPFDLFAFLAVCWLHIEIRRIQGEIEQAQHDMMIHGTGWVRV